MTRITSIETESFKGQDQCIKLAPRLVVHGDNGAGKTAIAQAIQFTIQGYATGRGLAKTADEQCAILGGPRGMAAEIALDCGIAFRRRMVRDPETGGVTSDFEIAGEGRVKAKEFQSRLDRVCGSFAPMLDINDFLALSADRQRDELLDLCGRAARATLSVDEIITRLLVAYLSDTDVLGPGVVDTFLEERFGVLRDAATREHVYSLMAAKLTPADCQLLEQAVAKLEQHVVGEGSEAIGAALEAAKSLVSASNAGHDEARARARGLSAQKAELAVVAGSIETLQQQHAEAAERLAEVRDEIGRTTERLMHLRTVADQIARHEATIAECRTPLESDAAKYDTDAAAAEADVAAHQARILELQQQMGALERAGAQAFDLRRLDQVTGDLRRLDAELTAATTGHTGFEDWTAEQCDDEAARLKAEATNIDPAALAADVRRIEEATLAAAREFTAVEREYRRAVADMLQAEGELRLAERRVAEAVDSPWGKVYRIINNLSGYCTGRESKRLIQELRDLIAQQSDSPTTAGAAKASADAAYRTAKQLNDEALARYTAAEKARSEADGQLAFARQAEIASREQHAGLMRRHTELVSIAAGKRRHAELTVRRAELQERLQQINAERESVEAASAEARGKKLQLAAEYDDLKARSAAAAEDCGECRQMAREIRDRITRKAKAETDLADAKARHVELTSGGLPSLTELEARRAESEARVQELAGQLEHKRRFDILDEEIQKAIASAEQQRRAHAIYTVLVRSVKVLREDVVRQLTAPVTGLMDEFLRGVFPECRAFIRLDNPTGKKVVLRMGWTRDLAGDGAAEDIYLPGMSGGERAIFEAALTWALVQLANPPLKVLMIEAGEVSTANLALLLRGIDGVADRIGNAIVMTHHADVTVPDGWQLISMDDVPAATPVESRVAQAASAV